MVGRVASLNRRSARRARLVGALAICSLAAAACGGPGRPSSSEPPATAPPVAPANPAPTTQPSVAPTAPTTTTPAKFTNSLFTQGDVASWPLAAESASYAADLVADYKADYGSVGVNTMPIYTVPAGAPEVPLSVTPGCADFRSSTGPEIPLPAYASLNGSSDNPLVIYQPSTRHDWELWRVVEQPDGGIAACWGGMLNVQGSSGVFPSPFGLAATGISYLATAITQGDVASGHIDHAIALDVPRCNGFVYPAVRGDCGTDPGQPGEGQWFRLPAGLAMPTGLSPFAQMVFVALQRYGAVITDQAGAVMVESEQTSDWSAEGHGGRAPTASAWSGLSEYAVLAALPWDKLQAVDPPGN